jgi:hypothetical protein
MFPPGGATTSNAWGMLVAQTFGPQAAGKTAAIVSENTDSGKYFVTAVTAGVKSSGLQVVSGTTPLPVPAAADYDAIAKQLLASSNGAAPDAIFVIAGYPNVAQLRQAVRNAGSSACSPTRSSTSRRSWGRQPVPGVHPTAAVEKRPRTPPWRSWSTTCAIAPSQLIDQSVIAGYWSADLLVAAVRARAEPHPRVAGEEGEHQVHLHGGGQRRPGEVPRRAQRPAPCGSLVQGTGIAYVIAAPCVRQGRSTRP